ncbi:MAG: hypothetical protein HFH54_13970 [Lachnospiraceae bacterium]|nr:hypothetical protein [Lachnospiraceae bacterium]
MKRGQLTEKETQLVKRVENEFGYFRYKMLSKSRKKIFKRCDKIRFYCYIYEYLMYADGIDKEHIEACLKYERPIAGLYRVYQRYAYLQYDRWEEIEELLNVLVREQEDRNVREDPSP